jgi:formylglycine-generating enzyme required for sulfatase activity
MNTIVISYRRHDSRDRARALLDRLAHDFPGRIGIGLEGLLPGENFRAKAQSQLHACRVLLVLIGPGWAQATDERGRPRLHDKRDWVRLEISVALQRQAHVVPVLVDGAVMPDEDELPPELHPLLDVQPLALPPPGDAQTESRVAELVTAIRTLLGEWPSESGLAEEEAAAAPVVAEPLPAVEAVPAVPVERALSPVACPVPVWASAAGEDAHGRWADLQVGTLVQRLRWIAPGTFLMGGEAGATERFADECPQHEVTLTHGFWLADTACTQAFWEALTGQNPSQFGGRPDHPVDSVRWDDVTALFLPALNSRLAGAEAVLPTEAQWEYACRAGTTTPHSFGAEPLAGHVNCDGQASSTLAVKALPPNPWGLYQMHGNVWEWCRDAKRVYTARAEIDPDGGQDDLSRVLRGGSWIGPAKWTRAACRFESLRGFRFDDFGFRFALRE